MVGEFGSGFKDFSGEFFKRKILDPRHPVLIPKKRARTNNGFVLKNNENTVLGTAHTLEELHILLKNNKEAFSFHVNNENNDFKNWARRELGYKYLSKKINRVTDINELLSLLNCPSCSD